MQDYHSIQQHLSIQDSNFSSRSFEEFFIARTAYEVRLSEVAVKARKLILELTNIEPILVGSFAIGIHDLSSDIDFILPVRFDRMKEVFDYLKVTCEFRGERPAKQDSTRFLFSIRIESVLVDISLIKPEDAQEFTCGISRAVITLTEEEKRNFAFMKHSLRGSITSDDFDAFKIRLYQRFCPNFVWEPDFVLRQSLSLDLPR